jgi:DNA polymerase III delta prime subunit
VKIDQASPERLKHRLIQIRKQEGVKMDDSILYDLMEKVKYDARSAITNLQFLSRKFGSNYISKKDLEESNMYSRNGGLKDSTINIFEATESILFGKFTSYDNIGLLNRIK